jgi:hypothetical protein
VLRKNLAFLLILFAWSGPLQAQDVARVEIQPSAVKASVGDTVRLIATVYDSDGNVIDAPTQWFTSYEVGTIDASGTFVAYSVGEREIGVMVGEEHVTIPVAVRPLPPSSIELAMPTTSIKTTSWMPLHAEVHDRLGSRVWGADISWSSSDPSVADVMSGFLVALKPGTAVITAQTGAASASQRVAVSAAPAGNLTLAARLGALRTGDVYQLLPTLNGQPLPSGSFPRFTVIGGKGAQVTEKAAFVAEAPGEYTVAAEFAGSTALTTLLVDEREFDRKLELVGHGALAAAHTGDLWLYKNAAYVGSFHDTKMRVYDVSDPANPVLSDSIVVDARRVNDVKVNADAGFAVITREGAANRRNGIVILDLADPLHPTIISEYTETVSGGVHNVFIVGDLVYATHGGTRDMHIIDVSDLDNPREVGRWGLDNPNRVLHDIFIKDGVAYLSYWDDGLVILDLGGAGKGGTPTEPVFVSRVYYPQGNTHVAWRWKNYVFTGDEIFPPDWDPESVFQPTGYVHVFDVTNLENPVEVAKYEVPEAGAHNLWIEDDQETLYIGYYNAGLRALDVSGELRGDLYEQGREIDYYLTGARENVRVPNAPMNWGAMYYDDKIFSADFNSGLWIHRWVPTGDRPIS